MSKKGVEMVTLLLGAEGAFSTSAIRNGTNLFRGLYARVARMLSTNAKRNKA